MKSILPQHFEINDIQNEFQIIETLSLGPFSENLLVENKSHQKFLAVVSTNKDLFLYNDVEKLIKIQCKSFLIPIGYSKTNFRKEDFPVLLFNYGKGSLGSFIAKEELYLIDGTKRFNILLGIAMALKYLHDSHQKYIFLNPDYIFLDENYYPQLLYLGTSLSTDDLVKSYMSTHPPLPFYLAPEILQYIKQNDLLPGVKFNTDNISKSSNDDDSPQEDVNHIITSESDIYSFSLLVFLLLSSQNPYDQLSTEKVSVFIEKVIDGIRPNLLCLPSSTTIIKVLEQSWCNPPFNRLSPEDIMNSMMKFTFFKYFEIDIDEVTEYTLNFEGRNGIRLTILAKNDPRLTDEDLDLLILNTGETLDSVLTVNANIEGNKFLSDNDDKDFDSQVDFMMYNGLKRRMNEIILFLAKLKERKRKEEEEDDNEEEEGDKWILNIAGFSFTSSFESDEAKSSQEKKKKDPTTSIMYG